MCPHTGGGEGAESRDERWKRGWKKWREELGTGSDPTQDASHHRLLLFPSPPSLSTGINEQPVCLASGIHISGLSLESLANMSTPSKHVHQRQVGCSHCRRQPMQPAIHGQHMRGQGIQSAENWSPGTTPRERRSVSTRHLYIRRSVSTRHLCIRRSVSTRHLYIRHSLRTQPAGQPASQPATKQAVCQEAETLVDCTGSATLACPILIAPSRWRHAPPSIRPSTPRPFHCPEHIIALGRLINHGQGRPSKRAESLQGDLRPICPRSSRCLPPDSWIARRDGVPLWAAAGTGGRSRHWPLNVAVSLGLSSSQ